MKQKQIVETVDVSKATVSRHLSEMEAEGSIERFRVGREKIVCLPEAVPEAATSR